MDFPHAIHIEAAVLSLQERKGTPAPAAAAASSGSCCPDALWVGKVQRRGEGYQLGPNPNLQLLDTTHHQVRSPPTGAPLPLPPPPNKSPQGWVWAPSLTRKGPLPSSLSLRGRVVFIPPPPFSLLRPDPSRTCLQCRLLRLRAGGAAVAPPSPPCSSASSSLPRPRLRLWQQRRRRRGLPSPPLPAAAPPGRG